MADGFSIRAATEDDLDGIMTVREAVASEGRWIGAEVPLDVEGDREMLRPGRPNTAMFVAVADDTGEVIGNIGLFLPPYRVVDLGMAIVDGWRGRGVGRALLDVGIQWARDQGAHKVALQFWPHNERARRLYESAGFVEEGYLRRHYPRKNGEIWDAVVMGLLLDDMSRK
jgi:RimJ/RimL family protein N-acetyltransferase